MPDMPPGSLHDASRVQALMRGFRSVAALVCPCVEVADGESSRLLRPRCPAARCDAAGRVAFCGTCTVGEEVTSPPPLRISQRDSPCAQCAVGRSQA
jgi:hypothetical protein